MTWPTVKKIVLPNKELQSVGVELVVTGENRVPRKSKKRMKALAAALTIDDVLDGLDHSIDPV